MSDIGNLLADFADAAQRAQRARQTRDILRASEAPRPVCLILHTLIFVCETCGQHWPAPQTTLKVRYDKGPDSVIGKEFLRREAATYLTVPREHKKIEILAPFCELCFDAASEVELGSIRSSVAASAREQPETASQSGHNDSTKHSGLDEAGALAGLATSASAVGKGNGFVPPRPAVLSKCLGDSNNRCGIMHVCRVRGCQLTQQRFSGKV